MVIENILVGIASGAVGGTISGFVLTHYAAGKNRKDRERQATKAKLDAVEPLLNFLNEAHRKALEHPSYDGEWKCVLGGHEVMWFEKYLPRMGTLLTEKIQRDAMSALPIRQGVSSDGGSDDLWALNMASLHESVKAEYDALKAASGDKT